MSRADYLEVDYELHYFYRSSWGGISPYFKSIVDDRQLLITRCPGCAKGFCPPRKECPDCWVETLWEPHSGEGTVAAPVYCYWVPSNSPVHEFTEMPFIYGLVHLDGTDTYLNALIHSSDKRLHQTVSVGTRVKVCFRAERKGYPTDIYFMPVDELTFDASEESDEQL